MLEFPERNYRTLELFKIKNGPYVKLEFLLIEFKERGDWPGTTVEKGVRALLIQIADDRLLSGHAHNWF